MQNQKAASAPANDTTPTRRPEHFDGDALADIVNQRRKDLGIPASGYFPTAKPIGEILPQHQGARPRMNDEEFERRETERAKQEEHGRRFRLWEKLLDQRGRRYAGCRLNNFELSDDPQQKVEQQKVLAAVTGYAKSMAEQVEAGNGIVAYGPCGVGKDHLLMALAHKVIKEHGLSVGFASVLDWFGRVRDTFGDDHQTEADVVGILTKPDILILSDLAPPEGELTSFQKATLYRAVDRRYADRKPTWVTINAKSREEADSRVGLPTIDRLVDGSVRLFCNWESYRK